MIDTHVHIEFPDFMEDFDEMLARSKEAGITKMITIGGEIPRNRLALELAQEYQHIFAILGIHPNWANSNSSEEEAWIRSKLSEKKVVGIGEIGLDYFHNYSLYETQKKVFRNYLEIAKEADLPVIIHTRESFVDTFEILKEFAPIKGVIHCFSYSFTEAEAFLSLGLHISFCGQITFKSKNCEILRETAKLIPIDKLLLETDCPFLTPEPKRGKRNEPAFVKFIAEKHAELRRTSLEEIVSATTKNAEKLFGI